eukprot:TRINITY_DN30737_c0_g1_i1.p1 TRINITY_DN30737_c0_g1~~TRINITY_DN30737_c0_g1_i1.p1  ORF type:complete len:468 (+),score=93.11 TRINITY_DN30737_c0_g1_i1:51-1454(+)
MDIVDTASSLVTSEFCVSEALKELVADAEMLKSPGRHSPAHSGKVATQHSIAGHKLLARAAEMGLTPRPGHQTPVLRRRADEPSFVPPHTKTEAAPSSPKAKPLGTAFASMSPRVFSPVELSSGALGGSAANQLAEHVRRAVTAIETRHVDAQRQLVLAVTQLKHKTNEVSDMQAQLVELQAKLDAADEQTQQWLDERDQMMASHAQAVQALRQQHDTLKHDSDSRVRVLEAQLAASNRQQEAQGHTDSVEADAFRSQIALLKQQLHESGRAREEAYERGKRERQHQERHVAQLQRDVNSLEAAREADAAQVELVLKQYHTALTKMLPNPAVAESLAASLSPAFAASEMLSVFPNHPNAEQISLSPGANSKPNSNVGMGMPLAATTSPVREIPRTRAMPAPNLMPPPPAPGLQTLMSADKFRQYDTDHDGKISQGEWNRARRIEMRTNMKHELDRVKAYLQPADAMQ